MVQLMWVKPHRCKRANVFGQPDEKSDKEKAQQQRHAARNFIAGEINPAAAINQCRYGKERQPEINDIVMAEKIGVNEKCQGPRPAAIWIV